MPSGDFSAVPLDGKRFGRTIFRARRPSALGPTDRTQVQQWQRVRASRDGKIAHDKNPLNPFKIVPIATSIAPVRKASSSFNISF
jgi:hypothetical protein